MLRQHMHATSDPCGTSCGDSRSTVSIISVGDSSFSSVLASLRVPPPAGPRNNKTSICEYVCPRFLNVCLIENLRKWFAHTQHQTFVLGSMRTVYATLSQRTGETSSQKCISILEIHVAVYERTLHMNECRTCDTIISKKTPSQLLFSPGPTPCPTTIQSDGKGHPLFQYTRPGRIDTSAWTYEAGEVTHTVLPCW